MTDGAGPENAREPATAGTPARAGEKDGQGDPAAGDTADRTGSGDPVRGSPDERSPASMWRHCLRCHADLGRNEALESFPVGERVAYDPEKGRLWVVCPACGRWNLSPLLARWEALEEAERRFRETPRRASTENIGLARLPEGLELVRVGADPLPDEFAAWRYADRFSRRLRRTVVWAAGGLAAGGLLLAGGMAAGIASGVVVPQLLNLPVYAHRFLWDRRVVARIPPGEGGGGGGDGPVVRGEHLRETYLRRTDAAGGWRLIVPHEEGEAQLTGPEAERAAGVLLAQVNRSGATRSEVEEAVDALEEHGGPDGFFGEAVREAARSGYGYSPVSALPRRYRLPLEMAAHESSERRALEGELEELEEAWREAEEIAAIADDLLLPAEVRRWITRQRRRLGG